MHGNPVKKEEVKQFISLYKKGESTRSIAKKFGRCHSIILWYFNKLNIKRRTRREAAKLGVRKGRIKIFKHQIPKSAKQMSLEKAYILGVLCGDGWISYNNKRRTYQIGLSATDKEFVDFFRYCLEFIYKIKPTNEFMETKKFNWKNKFITRLCSKVACIDLFRYGNFGLKVWRIPKRIKNAPLNLQAQFLKGFFDSEGNVDKRSRRVSAFSTNQKGIIEIKNLLNNFDIRSKIESKEIKGKSILTPYVLKIQDRKSVEIYNKYIGFTIKRKKEKLKQLIDSYKLWTTPKKETLKLRPLMIKLRKDGLSCEKIAKKLNIGMVTVWNHLQKENLKPKEVAP